MKTCRRGAGEGNKVMFSLSISKTHLVTYFARSSTDSLTHSCRVESGEWIEAPIIVFWYHKRVDVIFPFSPHPSTAETNTENTIKIGEHQKNAGYRTVILNHYNSLNLAREPLQSIVRVKKRRKPILLRRRTHFLLCVVLFSLRLDGFLRYLTRKLKTSNTAPSLEAFFTVVVFVYV